MTGGHQTRSYLLCMVNNVLYQHGENAKYGRKGGNKLHGKVRIVRFRAELNRYVGRYMMLRLKTVHAHSLHLPRAGECSQGSFS